MASSSRRVSKGSAKPPVFHTPIRKRQKKKTKAELLLEATERHTEKIRNTPTFDRYGREHREGTPIGSGDKQWRLQHGIGAKYSPKTPFLGIGISRDSFLPNECRVNDRMAMRMTPRSAKLSNEQIAFAKKYRFWTDSDWMLKFKMVCKRVAPIEILGLSKNLGIELRPLIYKRAGYTLQDKRAANAHFGGSTREQMLRAQLWQGDITASASDVFYFPSYKLIDKTAPSVLYGSNGPEYWKAKYDAELELDRQEAAPRVPHWSENLEMPQTMGTPNVEAQIPTAPAFSFGSSDRPPINGAQGGKGVNPPIYNVKIHNDPQFLPRYKTFGAKYRSMGYGENERRAKSRVPKSTEWGAEYKQKTEKVKNPARFGKLLAPKNTLPYAKYKLFG